MGHPHRLHRCDYRGKLTVFVTASTKDRHKAFNDAAVCDVTVEQLMRHASTSNVEVAAYCLMPDHAHVLLRGTRPESNIRLVINRWKQATGYWFKRHRATTLWQGNYWDHVLREEEDPLLFVHYIVMNPRRAAMVERLEEFTWLGSSCYSRQQLIDTANLHEQLLNECPG